MSWLTWTQLRPSAHPGQPPQQDDILPREVVRWEPIRWRISVNGRPLGWAAHDVERLSDGQGRVDSTVRIENLSMEQVLEQGFGSLGAFLLRGLGVPGRDGLGSISFTIENAMRFDSFGELESFESLVQEDSWGDCIRLQGTVRESQLMVKAYLAISDERGEPSLEPVYQEVIDLPPETLVVDSLSPRPRFRDLKVGQQWTFETYHPFFPTHPLQTIEASVEGRRMLRLGAEDVWTTHIVYRRGGDDGLSLERHLGDVYVSSDGTVVRQTLVWGGLTLTFDLQTTPAGTDAEQTPAGAPEATQPAKHFT